MRTPKKENPNQDSDKERHDRFVKSLAEFGNVRLACKAAGIARSWAYAQRAENPEFAEAWQSALQEGVDQLELEAWRRAKEKSDLLLIFLLKAHRPEVFREQVNVQHGGKIHHQVTDKLDREIDSLLEEMAARSEAAPSDETTSRDMAESSPT